MNVLLINPLCRLPYMLPLGLGYIASVLRENGHNVSVLDINGFGYSAKKVEEILKASEFDIVGIGGLSSTYRYVKWLSDAIRRIKPGVPIVAGNMVSTADPELLLKNSRVDIAVVDEGEITFAEVVSAVEKRQDLSGVKGIVYKSKGQIVKTAPRERITNLDSLPFPAWDLFPMEIYLNSSTATPSSFGMRQINISAVRGCPYECTFCSHPFGRRTYGRSAANVVNEIRELKKRYGAEFINFSDDLFMIDNQRVLEFCDRMISWGSGIKWTATGRVNLVNAKLMEKMREAGCAELGFGFESGSQEMLDGMKKRVAVKQAEDAIRIARASKIKVTGSFIFGMPHETIYTVRQTLEFIKRTRLPIYRFFYATPYPKTELYEAAKKMGRLPADEDKYMESLGEMRTTFLVNLTDFSDEELVRMKEWAESEARNSMSLDLKAEEFFENWQRRFIVLSENMRKKGAMPALKIFMENGTRRLLRKKEA